MTNGWKCFMAVAVTFVVGVGFVFMFANAMSAVHQKQRIACLRADLSPAQCDVIVGPDRWK